MNALKACTAKRFLHLHDSKFFGTCFKIYNAEIVASRGLFLQHLYLMSILFSYHTFYPYCYFSPFSVNILAYSCFTSLSKYMRKCGKFYGGCRGNLMLLSDFRGLAACLQTECHAELQSSISVAMGDFLPWNRESVASHTNCHERVEKTYQFHAIEISLQETESRPHIPHRHG